MKIDFSEWTEGADINLIPETVEEMAALARLSKNALAVKPEIYLSFRNDKPYCSIYLKKQKESVQTHSITNKK
jgi:hypothetical protein